ncbi:MAG: DUF4465 domain-containing protein [Kiritimatiellae bacterium]|nr:DUF4465 domain-containing protein [Kiritimatiellia bacterium]
MNTPLPSARRIAATAFLACILPVSAVRAALCTPDFGSVFEGLADDVSAINWQASSFETMTFGNSYNADWGSWSGFAISRAADTNLENASYANQYSACCTGKAAYAVGYYSDWDPAPAVDFAVPAVPVSCELALTTYTLGSLLNGDYYARAFAEGDLLDVTVSAYDAGGALVGATNVPLADYRGETPVLFTDWTEVPLDFPSPVSRLVFTMTTTDVGAWGANTPMYFALGGLAFRYAGGEEGIPQDDDAILAWADKWYEYTPGTNVTAEWAVPENALGAPGRAVGDLQITNGLVPLGDGGTITLGFPLPVRDGPGADFAVFENGMPFGDGAFLELAQVEVSSDGTNFVRFPCHSLETEPQGAFDDTSDTTAYGGLAGTTWQGRGNLFDLAALPASDFLDTGRVTHVRIRDVTGDGSVRDDWGNPIYDPYPTAESGGFDLSGIGAMNLALEITLAADETPPVLPGFATVLEWTDDLTRGPDGWTAVESRDAPGFYRWKLTRDAE